MTPPSGWRTAIGVISIVIGALGLLSSGFALLQMAAMSTFSIAPRAVATSTVTVTSGGATTQTTTTTPLPGIFAIPTSAKITSIAADSLNILLAAFLLFAGIAILRRQRIARMLHLIWCGLKIPLIILACIGQYQYSEAMFQSMNNMPGMTIGIGSSVAVLTAVFGGVLSLIYPVALLIILNIASIRKQLHETSTN